MRQKLGIGSSSMLDHEVLNAPVAVPGLTKNLPSSSYASNLCVPPQSRTSTSICRAVMSKLSASLCGMIVCPCVKPIRRPPCCTTFDSARLEASVSKSPLTTCRSGDVCRRKSYVSRSVMLPRHMIWPILPGVRSLRNYHAMSVEQLLASAPANHLTFAGMSYTLSATQVPVLESIGTYWCSVRYKQVANDQNKP